MGACGGGRTRVDCTSGEARTTLRRAISCSPFHMIDERCGEEVTVCRKASTISRDPSCCSTTSACSIRAATARVLPVLAQSDSRRVGCAATDTTSCCTHGAFA